MFHTERNKPVSSQISVASLDSLGNLSCLQTLLNLVGSCCGPDSSIHMVRNTCGGHVTMTSDSGRLLASLSLSQQILKLIVSSVQGHLKEFGDGGKFLACTCLNLIKLTVQECGKSTNRRAYCTLYEKFVKIVSEYLNSQGCAVCVNIDLADIHLLLAYTRSVICTRPLLNLSDSDCNKLSELIVKCFVESIPEQEEHSAGFAPCHSDGILIIGFPLEHSRYSSLLKGLLLECPEIHSLKGELALNPVETDQSIKVALVTCSMSGDLEDIVSATYEVTPGQASSTETLVLDRWSDFCERLAHRQVGILLCQKVIHPRLKMLLKSLNIIAVDRLGSAVIPYIKDLTGAQAIVSVTSVSNPESLVGYISRAQHVILNEKNYLHLEQSKSSAVTLILYSRTDESLEEFKCCVKASMRGLHSLLREGKLLAGAGCWQIHCSYVLDEQVRKYLPALVDATGCSESQVLSALSAFRSAVFHHWVQLLCKEGRGVANPWATLVVDLETKHCWRTPIGFSEADSGEKKVSCCCGLKSTAASTSGPVFTDLQSFPMVNPSQDSCLKSRDCVSNSGENSWCRTVSPASSLSVFDTESSSSSSTTKDPCSSGIGVDRPVTISATLDHFSAASQGLLKAVFTANLVLSLGQIISDD